MIKLREIRKEKNVTMKQVGKVIGVSESAISQYENGKRQPDQNTLVKLADFFNVSVDVLLGREPQKDTILTSDDNISEPEALTEKEKQLILDFRSLNSQGQELILQQMFMTKEVYKKDTDVSDVEIVG